MNQKTEKNSLPDGVSVGGIHPWEVRYEDGIPTVWVEAQQSDYTGDVRLTVDEGAVCNLLVHGDGDGEASVRGKGVGDAIRIGDGAGGASRMEGSGSAVRKGNGDGNSFCSVNGHGNAERYGAGGGDARCRSATGDAIRKGDGRGNAERDGAGEGDAIRSGYGAGNAIVSGGSHGSAVRDGPGPGHAIHVGGGEGTAERNVDGKGRCFSQPAMTMAAWEKFAGEWVRGDADEALSTPVSGWHRKAQDYGRRVRSMIEGGRAKKAIIPILVASAPELGKEQSAGFIADKSLLGRAEGAIAARLERAALAAIRDIHRLHSEQDAQQGVSLDSLEYRIVEKVHARLERGGSPLAHEVVEEVLRDRPLSMPQLSEIFANNPALWEDKASGDSLEDQMRASVVKHLMDYANREIEMNVLLDDEEQGAAPAV